MSRFWQVRKFSDSLFSDVYEIARTTLYHFVNQELSVHFNSATFQCSRIEGGTRYGWEEGWKLYTESWPRTSDHSEKFWVKELKGKKKKSNYQSWRWFTGITWCKSPPPHIPEREEKWKTEGSQGKKKECVLSEGTKRCHVKQSQDDPYRGAHGVLCFR